MNVDTPTPLGLSLAEAEKQRTTKRPRMSGFKATRCGVETIKKTRERELRLRRLEAMVGVSLHWDHIETLQPPACFPKTWMERKLGLV